jgi:hypothetical protein
MMGAWRFSAASVLVSVFRQSLPLQSNFRTYTPTAKTACFFDWVFGRSDRDFVSPLSHLSPPPPTRRPIRHPFQLSAKRVSE